MNILFSSDDNYAQHLGVAMYSLMIHNQKAKKLNFFVVDNHISEDNLSKLKQVVEGFSNSTINFISFDSFAKELILDMPWPISLSAYARLFAAEILPKDIDRVLYLDCDMVINHDLSDLWNIDLQGKCIGAVQDQVRPSIKESVGLQYNDRYFNSGLLLVDLRQWRIQNIGNQALEFIRIHEGRVTHHDQGVLNGLLHTKWMRLPLKYNVMTIHYLMKQSDIVKYYKEYSEFYGQQEISFAINYPCIIHYTPSFTSRPWELNCKHPLRILYNAFLSKTPWMDYSLSPERIPWYIKIINYRYRNLPI